MGVHESRINHPLDAPQIFIEGPGTKPVLEHFCMSLARGVGIEPVDPAKEGLILSGH